MQQTTDIYHWLKTTNILFLLHNRAGQFWLCYIQLGLAEPRSTHQILFFCMYLLIPGPVATWDMFFIWEMVQVQDTSPNSTSIIKALSPSCLLTFHCVTLQQYTHSWPFRLFLVCFFLLWIKLLWTFLYMSLVHISTSQ